MSTVYFITHPDVVIDPATPVTQWPLSQRGRMRMRKMAENQWISRVVAIYCSTEQKAMDGAAIMSEVMEIPYTTIPEFGENDRSATGYLSASEFEAVVDEFFLRPEESVRGWERAIDAQRRIIAATRALLMKRESVRSGTGWRAMDPTPYDGQAGRRQRCHRRAWRGWNAASVPSRRRAD
jgi:hypothetical protein